jgi:hypothetical protein
MSEKRIEGVMPPQTIEYESELAGAVTIVAKISQSKGMVVAGFFISLLGIACYCYVSLSKAGESTLLYASLSLVAIGFILWLVGAICYFNLAIDSGDSDAIF